MFLIVSKASLLFSTRGSGGSAEEERRDPVTTGVANAPRVENSGPALKMIIILFLIPTFMVY